MDYLSQNNFDSSFKLLKNCEKILENNEHKLNDVQRIKLLSITFNNLGCYYRKYFYVTCRLSKPNVSLYYLRYALSLDEQLPVQ